MKTIVETTRAFWAVTTAYTNYAFGSITSNELRTKISDARETIGRSRIDGS